MRELHRQDQFKADIKKLDNSVRIRAKAAVDKIQEKPDLGKPLKHELASLFSEHFSIYRIIYRYGDKTIYLLRCQKRKNVYN
jgi:mRNA-degrading endonuclease RelE of RelBE toxin-antitoxin system